jgi:hypothetical protein
LKRYFLSNSLSNFLKEGENFNFSNSFLLDFLCDMDLFNSSLFSLFPREICAELLNTYERLYFDSKKYF